MRIADGGGDSAVAPARTCATEPNPRRGHQHQYKGRNGLRTVAVAHGEKLGSFGNAQVGPCCVRFHLVGRLDLPGLDDRTSVPRNIRWSSDQVGADTGGERSPRAPVPRRYPG
jgi:hypothetical protein